MNIRAKALGKALGAMAALFLIAGSVQAHLVSFGWTDNGNGTVTLWGEHWHSDQTVASTANGGITISDPTGTNPSFTAQWIGVQNNTDRDAMVANGTLTGYDTNTGNPGQYDDWFYTTPLVIGNGTWNFLTGSNCCIDTMLTPVQITLTGITSVPGGTGPSSAVPAPSALALLGLGLVGMMSFKRRQKQA